MSDLQSTIEAAWEARTEVNFATKGAVRDAVDAALGLLDSGKARVAEKTGNDWTVHQWLKQAVLLSFRLNPNTVMGADTGGLGPWYDKVATKFTGWGEAEFAAAGFRAGQGAILMPSFVNIGGYVDEGTMVDSWSTVGSCAQIGKNVHLSGGVGIGGVLEPLQANPNIIENDCFIGARSEVAEGVIVRQGAVLSMGVYLGASTKIVDRATGEVFKGEVPPYAVVVPGSLPGKDGGPGLYCAVIVKRVDAQTRSKTSVNELLRD